MLIGVVKPALQHRELKQLNSPVEVKLAHGVGLVRLDGLDAQGEAGGDLLVAVAERDEAETSVSRSATTRAGLALRTSAMELPLPVMAGSRKLPPGDRADGLKQHVRVALFEHVAGGPGLEELLEVRAVRVARQRDDVRRRGTARKPPAAASPLISGIERSIRTRSISSRPAYPADPRRCLLRRRLPCRAADRATGGALPHRRVIFGQCDSVLGRAPLNLPIPVSTFFVGRVNHAGCVNG